MMSLKENLKKEVTFFVDNWSGHGVSRIAISRNIFKKVFYTLVFLVCMALFAYQISMLVRKYNSYPVNTVLSIQHTSLPFPAITICNKNTFRKSKYSLAGDTLQAIVNRSEETFLAGQDYNYNNYSEYETASTSSPESESTTVNNDYAYYDTWGDSSQEMFQNPSDIYHEPGSVAWLKAGEEPGEITAAQEISMALAKVNITTRLEMGHQLSEMLQSCSINRETCSTKNFTSFYNVMYGNCYTFNGMTTARDVTTFQSGPMFGLKLDLVIEQDEYVGSLTRTAGIRLTVHDPFDFPFPEDNGIDLAPGKETSVALRLKKMEKLAAPYSSCTSGTGRQIAYKGKYTVEACRKTCLQDSIVDRCNCTDTRYSNADFYSAMPCDMATDFLCITEALDEHHQADNCDCPARCQLNVYEQTVSSGDYPSISSEGELRDIIMSRSARLEEIFNQTDTSTVPNNLLQVQIYYETLQHEVIREQAAYDFESLVSDIGGQAGLFIGWSLFSFIEIIEFIGKVIWILIKYLLFRGKTSPVNAVRVTSTK